MRKITSVFLFCLFCAFITNAQITITQSDYPPIGNTYLFAFDSTATTSAGSSGANQVWNLSTLKFQKTDTTAAISPVGTPEASKYPTANYVERTNISAVQVPHTSWVYYNLNADSLEYLGFYQPTTGYGNAEYVPPLKLVKFPSSVGTSFRGSAVLAIFSAYPSPPYDSLKYIINQVYSDTVDGYGTVTTPYGTYTNAIRQRTIDKDIDSAFVRNSTSGVWSLLGKPSSSIDSNFQWYVKGLGNPVVAQISFNPPGGSNGTYLLVKPAGVQSVESNSAFLLYPNPASAYLNIHFDKPQESNIRLTLIDDMGRIVMDEESAVNSNSATMNVSCLVNGVYFVRVVSNTGTQVVKFIKQ